MTVSTSIDVNGVDGPAECIACTIAREGAENGSVRPLGSSWIVNARVGHRRPALVVQPLRHREGLRALSEAEHRELGAVLSAASIAVEAEPHVARAYVGMWNESSPHHVHFHVEARMDDDTVVGPGLPDITTPQMECVDTERMVRRAVETFATRADPGAAEASADAAPPEISALVRAVQASSRWWNAHCSVYRLLVNFLDKPGRLHKSEAAEIYVGAWVLALIALLVGGRALHSAPAPSVLAVAAGVVVGYRVADILVFEIGILLSTAPAPLWSIPRAIVLRGLNLAELGLGVAVIQAWFGHARVGFALEAGFNAIALQPQFGNPGWFVDVMSSVAALVSLMILSGGLAMLLGKRAEQFTVRRSP